MQQKQIGAKCQRLNLCAINDQTEPKPLVLKHLVTPTFD